MNLSGGLPAGFAEGAQEVLAVLIVFEDVAAMAFTIDD
jgi:hypothetical protein